MATTTDTLILITDMITPMGTLMDTIIPMDILMIMDTLILILMDMEEEMGGSSRP